MNVPENDYSELFVIIMAEKPQASTLALPELACGGDGGDFEPDAVNFVFNAENLPWRNDNGLEIISKELASARGEQPGDASRQPI